MTDIDDGMDAEPALVADAVSVRFGGLVALDRVSLEVPPASIVGLVGPNGAGKSTLFSVLSGLRRPVSGAVRFRGADVSRLSAAARSRLGLARSFQQPEIFPALTVREHLTLAYRARHCPRRVWQDIFLAGALRRTPTSEAERVDSLLDLLALGDVADLWAGALPLGTSRLVEVGRALAASPSVLLLDEPLSGLDFNEARHLAVALNDVAAREGIAMLLVEHDVAMVLELSSVIYVLDFGTVIATGTPEEIRNDSAVRAAYLGDADSVTSTARAPRTGS